MRTSRIEGIVPPLVTPLLPDGSLDEASLERLVEHLVTGGVHGMFLLGTSGEGPSLAAGIQRRVISRGVQAAAGRLPVLVGISHPCIAESLDLARHAADAGATAVVATPPFYFEPDTAELTAWVRLLAEEQPLPLFLYNFPQLTKAGYPLAVLEAAREFGQVVGVKDSSGDPGYFEAVLRVASGRPDWSVLIGPEHLLGWAVRMGGQGGVNGGAQIFPGLLVAIHEAARRGDAATLDVLGARLARLGMIYDQEPGILAGIKGMKVALACLGLCGPTLARPYRPLDAAARGRIEAVVCGLRDGEPAPRA